MAATTSARFPRFLRDRPGLPSPDSRGIFLSIVAGNFIVLLDVSILNVALPSVRTGLDAPASALPWASDAYTIVFGGLLMAAGALADRWGPRRVYELALLAFAVLSALCAAAPDIAVLIAGRALLGVAAAGLVPASLALLAMLYPDPARRARAVGNWAAASSVGLVAGPVLGGALVAAGGWRLVLLVNPPVALAALAFVRLRAGDLATAVRPSGPGTAARPALDVAGLALSIIGLGALAFALIDGGESGWSRPVPVVVLLVAVACIAALGYAEHRSSAPLLPPVLLRNGRVAANLVTGGMASLVFYGVFFAVTLWLQDARGLTALQTGLFFLPMTLPMCFMPMIAGRLVARFGGRHVMIAGLGADVIGGALLALAGTRAPFGLVIAAEVALVLGSTLAIPGATADMATAAPKHLAGTAQGTLNACRQAGAALGVAILGTAGSLGVDGLLVAAGAGLAALFVAVAHRGTAPVMSG